MNYIISYQTVSIKLVQLSLLIKEIGRWLDMRKF